MTPADRRRIAQLAAWREQWLALAATVRRHANVRAEEWVRRHVPERFGECMPWQLPVRLQRRWRRREDRYADHLTRADRHEATAEACAKEIARIKAEAKARRPVATQGALL